MKSDIEVELRWQLRAAGLPDPESEYRFHDKRFWRFDFAYPDHCLAIEIEGGVFNQGRHQQPLGFINDIEKYNTATLLGWRILRFTGDMIHDGRALNTIEWALNNPPNAETKIAGSSSTNETKKAGL